MMSGYRDLPMGRHDERVMAGRDAVEGVHGIRASSDESLPALDDCVRVDEHEGMLEQMQWMRTE